MPDGLYYTGVTNDLERRLAEHNDGYHPGCFTFKRRSEDVMNEHFITSKLSPWKS
ncbi:MAG: GIY-YIG nuclease family protein [Chitinophagaceae bacterium]|nr:GIY-YIG nuclease family protein [Chitinophagaceae bacterium]